MKRQIRNMVLSSFFLALGYVLPFVTGQIPQIGNMLLPMHIPVLLCGFICGPWWGLAVGLILPILRSLMLTMPPMYPKAIAMSFELMTYGFVSGTLYRALKKTRWSVIVSLLAAMVSGRIVWGIARLIMALGSGASFPLSAFIAGAVTTAVPGIIVQLIVIPAVLLLIDSKGLIER